MKKTFTLLFSSFLVFSAHSQLTKGNWLVGGTGSFYSYTEEVTGGSFPDFTAEYTSIDFSATGGYFFIDKFSAGLRSTISSYKGKVTSDGGGATSNFRFSVGPYARYYILQADKPFNLLMDISYQIGANRNGGSEKNNGKYNILTLSAGTEVFFNSAVGLEILLGYSHRKVTIDDPQISSLNNKRGLHASVGFQFHLQNN